MDEQITFDDILSFEEKEDFSQNLKSLFELYDTVIVFDTETSGLNHTNDQIIEFAAIWLKKVDGKVIISKKTDEFIKPYLINKLSPKITSLTGITDEDINNGKEITTVISEFVEDLSEKNTLLVAHNVQFDIGFLYTELVREGLKDLIENLDVLDSLTIYKDRRPYPHKLCNAIESYNLSDVVKNSHRAIDDVEALYMVLIEMDKEFNDLNHYINIIGFNPKYPIPPLEKYKRYQYIPQPYYLKEKLYMSL